MTEVEQYLNDMSDMDNEVESSDSEADEGSRTQKRKHLKGKKTAERQQTKEEKLSSYELERNRKINQNIEMMKQLGLKVAKAAMEIIPKRKDKTKSTDLFEPDIAIPEFFEPRQSKRLRGEAPASEKEIELLRDQWVTELQDTPLEANTEDIGRKNGSYSECLWMGKKRKHPVTKRIPEVAHVPLTLGSIATTILSVGRLMSGSDEGKYWSNAGCLYRHRYPVGWTAVKTYLGKEYQMEILEGAPGKGPIFQVKEVKGSKVWKGNTPTAPWTSICMASKSPNARVSGPLFYGFSDPISQLLIKQLEEETMATQNAGEPEYESDGQDE